MRRLILIGLGAFVGGSALGFGTGRVYWEGKIREEYQKATESMRRSFEIAAEIQTKKAEEFLAEAVKVPTEEELDAFIEAEKFVEEIDFNEIAHPDVNVFPVQEEPAKNEYHRSLDSWEKAVSADETPFEMFVEGGINDYGVSYIEEEEYLEDDGRFKGKIDILMDDHNPVFLMDGKPIDDWDTKVGDSILVDFYRLVPPGVDPILYVRNHRTDEDYEVVRVEP